MKGAIRAGLGGLVNDILLRTFSRPFRPEKAGKYHFVCAHPDDEVAILNQVRKAIKHTDASFTLVTNGTQGFETKTHTNHTLESFGNARIEEFATSLERIGYIGRPVLALVDEKNLYMDILERNHGALAHAFDFIVNNIESEIREVDGVFVNDFAGGHMIHDIVNMLTCQAAKRTQTPVYEYWQAFLRVPRNLSSEDVVAALKQYYETEEIQQGITQVGGLVGDDSTGRITRDGHPHKYTVEIPNLGIKKGRAFNGIYQIRQALKHLKEVYIAQKESTDRLKSLTLASHGIDAPRFREINLDEIDHTRLPEQGILYDHAIWRVRGLPRMPNSQDYLDVVSVYLKNRN